MGVYAQLCTPRLGSITNDYPQYAPSNQQITITTTVTVDCMQLGYQVTVDILPSGSSNILSFAPGLVAVNRITTPATFGPWTLNVIVQLMEYPLGRITGYHNDTIVVQVVSGMTTQVLTSVEYSTETESTMLTSTISASTSTITETAAAYALASEEDQGSALAAAILGACFVLLVLMLLKTRRERSRTQRRPTNFGIGLLLFVMSLIALSTLTVGYGTTRVGQVQTITTMITSTGMTTVTESSILQTTQSIMVTTETSTMTQSILPQGGWQTLGVLFAVLSVVTGALLVRARKGPTYQKFCINCGAKLLKEEDFCTKCGTKQEASAPQLSPQRAQEPRPSRSDTATEAWFCDLTSANRSTRLTVPNVCNSLTV